MKESSDDARVGVDKFVTYLLGKIDHIDICGANRWVRQGQKLITLHSGNTSVDLLSPVEGVVTAINNDAFGRSHSGHERSLRTRLARHGEVT